MSSRLSIPLLGSYLQESKKQTYIQECRVNRLEVKQADAANFCMDKIPTPALGSECRLASSTLQQLSADQVPSSFFQLFEKLKYAAQGKEQFPRSQSPKE